MIWPQPIPPAVTLLWPFILPSNIQISKLNCCCLFTILSCLCRVQHVTLLFIDWVSLWTLPQHHYKDHVHPTQCSLLSPTLRFLSFLCPTKVSWWSNEVPHSIPCPLFTVGMWQVTWSLWVPVLHMSVLQWVVEIKLDCVCKVLSTEKTLRKWGLIWIP